MRVDHLTVTRERSGHVVRRAQVRTAGRTIELFVRIAPPLAEQVHDRIDGSPFVAAGLLAAMVAGEDLVVDAPVSARLAARLDDVVTAFARWDPTLRPPRIVHDGGLEPLPPGIGVGCYFSRGVDSMASAALERSEPGPLTRLVFIDGIEPRHTPPTAAGEVRLAGAAATRLGLPLCVVQTNIRDLLDAWRDWVDVHGAALAAVALCFDGALGAAVVPSTHAFDELAPSGSSPVLEPLLSTESVTVHHDTMAMDRVAKVHFLAGQRPDLLPLLKVCYAQDRNDNCGRCPKCLLTMGALQSAGALDRASGFPAAVPLDAVRGLRLATMYSRLHWLSLVRALGRSGPDADLRAAVEHALWRSARPGLLHRTELTASWLTGRRPSPSVNWHDPTKGFSWRHHDVLWRAITRGAPLEATSEWAEAPLIRRRARPAP